MRKLCAGFLSPQPLDDPRARRMLRDIEMHYTPAMVADDEHALEARRDQMRPVESSKN
jgi:hypothetical protein